MPYVPNASDATQPTEDKSVESAALEFRTMKVDLVRSLKFPLGESAIYQGPIPAAASRAGRFLAFDSVTGQPAIGPLITDWTITQAQITSISTVASNMPAILAVSGQAAAAAASATAAAGSASAASGSATAAGSSATAAATSATNSAASATASAGSATTAETHKNAAATSATNANTAATSAQSFATAAQGYATSAQSYSNLANTYANNAATSATAAAASATAASGYLAPVSSTSATSNTMAVSSLSFTIETGKPWVAGMPVKIAVTASPTTNYMTGTVVSYNSGTGALVVAVSSVAGSGTYAAWTLSLAGGGGAALGAIPVGGGMTLETSLVVNNLYDGTDGTRWQLSGVGVPYNAARHDLTNLPEVTKSFFITTNPPTHNAGAWFSTYGSVSYNAASNTMLSQVRSNNNSFSSFYTTLGVSTNKGATWNYTLGVPLQSSYVAFSAYGPIVVALGGNTVATFNGSSWATTSTIGGFTPTGIYFLNYTLTRGFVMIFSATNGSVYSATSSNGTSWTTLLIASGSGGQTTYNTLNNSAIVLISGTAYYSATFASWVSANISSINVVGAVNGTYVALNSGTGNVSYSTTGTSWTSLGVFTGASNIGYAAGNELLYLVNNSFTAFWVSNTGSTWLSIGANQATSLNPAMGGYYLTNAISIPIGLGSYSAISNLDGKSAYFGSALYLSGGGSETGKVFRSLNGGVTLTQMLVTGATWVKLAVIGSKLYALTDIGVWSTLDGATWTAVTSYTSLGGSSGQYCYVGSSSVIITGGATACRSSGDMTNFYAFTNPYTAVNSTNGTDCYLVQSSIIGSTFTFKRLTSLNPSGTPAEITVSAQSTSMMRTK